MPSSHNIPRRLALLCTALLPLVCVGVADAQCTTCAQPVVAYSPVVQASYAPAAQTVVQPVGWYPGKYVRRLFGWGDPVVASTYTTAAYQPTYPPTYTAGYAPRAYRVGYAPTAYSVGYAPAAYTVGYAGQTCNACGCNPCGCTTGYRAVTLSPVASCCPSCPTGCSSCGGGVAQAGYDSSCPNCAGGATQQSYQQPYYGSSPSDRGNYGAPTPAPGVNPNATIPETRDTNRPPTGGASEGTGEATGEKSAINTDEAYYPYFQAPELHAPQARTTMRTTAPIRNAVYRQPTNARQASAHRPRTAPRQPTYKRMDVNAWGSGK